MDIERETRQGSSISSRATLRTAALNKYKRWIPATEAEVGDQRSAMARLSRPDYFIPNITPKFTLDGSKPIFTIGSCFAREIEDFLISKDHKVINAGLRLDPELLVGGAGPANHPNSIRAVLNKYSTAAMLNALEPILEPSEVPNDGFIEVEPGLWQDPQLSLLRLAPMDVARATRAEVARVTSEIRAAGSVFITLGLTETWRDTVTGLYMNAGPQPSMLRNDKGRFVFENRDVIECLHDVQKIIDLVNRHTSAKIIVTVSPVPLGTTWTAMDVAIANSQSKSTLRAVAGLVASQYANVDYFPSYEMVTLSPRSMAFGEDQLHVRRPMVEQVMKLFMQAYFDKSQS